MTFDELKDKAHSLPLKPGVYIMQDAKNTVIYVGLDADLLKLLSALLVALFLAVPYWRGKYLSHSHHKVKKEQGGKTDA